MLISLHEKKIKKCNIVCSIKQRSVNISEILAHSETLLKTFIILKLF
jgi:hypothetical protein